MSILLQCNINLKQLTSYTPFSFKNIIEIGVGAWDMSRSRHFLEDPLCKVKMIEPNTEYYQDLKRASVQFPNLTVENVAIGDFNGVTTLYQYGQESYIKEVIPPISANKTNRFENPITIQSVTSDMIDSGDIDLLLADVEGAEWLVLKNLKSRPRIIGIETHCENRYTNPDIQKIWKWMNDNTYKCWFRNTTDSYYIRGNDLGWGNGGNNNWQC